MSFRASSVFVLATLAALASGCVDTSEADADLSASGGSGEDSSGDTGGGTSDGSGGNAPTSQAPEGLSCGTLIEPEHVVLGYLPTWAWNFDERVQALDYDTLTHVAIAFANPAGDGKLAFEVEDSQIAALVTTAHSKDVKVLVSIAGASDSALVHQYIVADKVDAFVADIAAFVEKHGFDGVDVDIEGSSVDVLYTPFITKLAAAIRPDGKLLSAAVARNSWDRIDDTAMWCFDFLNLMTYDYAGTWGDASEHSTLAQARADLSYWSDDRRYPAARSVLGMPFYGYCWGTSCPHGYTPFSEIAGEYPDQTGVDWIVAGDQTISFNGTDTITKKTQLGQEHGGVMVWELTQDTTDAMLWNAIKAGL